LVVEQPVTTAAAARADKKKESVGDEAEGVMAVTA
jgi:hypothetical protein